MYIKPKKGSFFKNNIYIYIGSVSCFMKWIRILQNDPDPQLWYLISIGFGEPKQVLHSICVFNLK